MSDNKIEYTCPHCPLRIWITPGTKVHHQCPGSKNPALHGRSRGLGDTIAKITEATGVAKVVKKIAGKDCGCRGRQEALNKILPYKE